MLGKEGSVPMDAMDEARIAVSVPIINSFVHPISAAPILASHPFDLQYIPEESDKPSTHAAHSGPPSVNVEVKLTNVDDEAIEKGNNPVGILLVRGPPVGKLLGLEDYVSVPTPPRQESDGWIHTGARGEVRSNGSFVIFK